MPPRLHLRCSYCIVSDKSGFRKAECSFHGGGRVSLCSIKFECVLKPFVPPVLITKTHYAEYPIKSFSFLFFLQFFSPSSFPSLSLGTSREVALAITTFVPKLSPHNVTLAVYVPLSTSIQILTTQGPDGPWQCGTCRLHPTSRTTSLGRADGKEVWAQNKLLNVHSCHENRKDLIPYFSQKNLFGEFQLLYFLTLNFSFWLFKIVLISQLGFPSVHAICIHPLSLLIYLWLLYPSLSLFNYNIWIILRLVSNNCFFFLVWITVIQ